MPDMEAIGDAVTGGMIARAVEPKAGEAGSGEPGAACLNCGCALTGDYCHCCGQKAQVHRTLGAFWHDLLHSVLHFEGKIWRTLPMLAWRPGELTRRYIAGERARFVSPMALFLFSVFLMFIVFTTVGGPFRIEGDANDPASAAAEYRQERAQAQTELQELEAERQRLVAEGRPTTEVDVELRVARNAVALVERLRANELTQEQRDADPERRTIASGSTPGGKRARVTIGRTGIASIDQALERAEANPELLLYKIQNNAYKFSWLLIPLSVPFVAVLFLHRRRYRQHGLYDHTVFATYSIAFMSLGLVALTFVRLAGVSEALIGLALFFVPPLHIYRQLKGAYGLSRWSAIWRTLALLVFAVVATTLFLSVLVLIGALG